MIRIAALLALAGAKVAAVLTLAAGAAWAEPVKTSHSTVELIAEQGSLPAAGGALVLGLHLAPDPTWHAYWANPGDAGKEPSMKWALPEGFEAGPLQFPAPHLVPFGDLNTYAFEEPIVLLAEVAVPGGCRRARFCNWAARPAGWCATMPCACRSGRGCRCASRSAMVPPIPPWPGASPRPGPKFRSRWIGRPASRWQMAKCAFRSRRQRKKPKPSPPPTCSCSPSAWCATAIRLGGRRPGA